MIYNVSMKMGNLLENEVAVGILGGILPGICDMAKNNSQALELSVEQLIRYTRVPGAEEIVKKIDIALQELNTPENAISPSEAKMIERFLEIDKQEKLETKAGCTHSQNAIYPGEVWLDTNGKRIQAHGGAVIYENGIYYWYGENKEYTDGKNGIWTWGIKVYSSADLCNWKDEGYLIPPVLDNPNSSMFPTKRVDRPHILKCPNTGKYVCWIKLSGAEAAFTIWQSESLLGPYEMVENIYNPGNHKAGDFDLILDEESGKGYLYFDADHQTMICMELTNDFTHAQKEVARNYPKLNPPFTREAPALFEAKGKKYMLTSGMTGYIPNRSDCACADTWDDVFVSMGNPHVNDESEASFNSQISKVFPVVGKENCFVAMADRWVPNYLVDARIADLFTRVIASNYEPEKYQATDDERKEMYEANVLDKANTQIADYVWLPITVEAPSAEYPNGVVRIEWKDEWNLQSLK